ncbi:MAG: hypothetical protein EPN85_07070, partial [Bacteroidetes bacterium]
MEIVSSSTTKKSCARFCISPKQMAKTGGIGFLKLVLLGLTIVNPKVHAVFAQLDVIHWFPPLHSRDDNKIEDHYVYLSTPKTTPFVVTIKDGAGNTLAAPSIDNANPFVYTIGNGQFPGTPAFVPEDSLNVVLKKSGLILTAPEPFYADLRARAVNHAASVTAKGTAAAGTTFRFGAFPLPGFDTDWNFTAGIIATANNTTITITGYDPGIVFAGVPNVTSNTLTFTLNQGECYVVSGYANTAPNLTGFIGALIQSNNPIVLSNGNLIGNIGTSGNDMGIDQSVPIDRVGQNYILIKGLGGSGVEAPIVIAHYNNTDIFINGNPVPIATINAGQYYMAPYVYQGTCNMNMHIRTSQPAYMYQSLSGGSDKTGGLNFIPPYSCGLPDTIDLIPFVDMIGSTTYTGGVMVFTQQGATLKINGITQTCAEPVLSAPWETYRITGLTGHITLTSTGAMAAGIFGRDGDGGFAGFYAGFSSNILPFAGADASICSGQGSTLNASGGVGYSWFPSSGLSNPNISNPVANPSVTTAYTVTVTDANGCSGVDSVIVTVIPFVANAGPDVSICQGQSSTLNASGGVNYVWSPAAGLSNATISNPVANPSVTTAYTVTVTNASGCIGVDSITVAAVPFVASAGPDVSICQGQSSTLNASGGSGYSWSPASGLSNPNISNPVASPSSSAMYIVIVDANGCSNTDTINITVDVVPSANAGADLSFCAGFSATLSASGGSSYSWTPSTGLSNPNISNPAANPASSTTYTVIVSNGNCTSTDVMNVDVSPIPVASISAQADVSCFGWNNGSATVSVSVGTNPITYLWNPSSQATQTATGLSAGSYSVQVTDANGCTAVSGVVITEPAALSLNLSSTNAGCGINNGTVSASASGGTTPFLYLWSNGATQPAVSNLTAQLYSVTITDANGCTTTATVNISQDTPPVASISGNTSACMGGSVILSASGGGNYVWNTGATNSSITIIASASGSFSVAVISGNCSDTASIYLNVYPLPTANAGNDTTIMQYQSATLNGSGGTSFLWTPSTDMSCYTCQNPVASPMSTTTYTLLVTSGNGCTAIDIITVTVTEIECNDPYLPNAFSPNEDHENDKLKIYINAIQCVTDFKLVIYNRWGEKIF